MIIFQGSYGACLLTKKYNILTSKDFQKYSSHFIYTANKIEILLATSLINIYITLCFVVSTGVEIWVLQESDCNTQVKRFTRV